MKVKDLILELQKLDGDMVVVSYDIDRQEYTELDYVKTGILTGDESKKYADANIGEWYIYIYDKGNCSRRVVRIW